jgi:hypothetical protein
MTRRKMIATFPQMSAIDNTVRHDIARLTEPWRAYQQFSFTVMASCDSGTDTVAELAENLVFNTAHPVSGLRAYVLCGRHSIADTARTILQSQRHEGARLHLVPEDVARALSLYGFNIERDEAASEYVLNLDQTLLAVTKSGRRRAACQFAKLFRPTFEVLDLRDERVAPEIETVAARWRHDRLARAASETLEGASEFADLAALHRLLRQRHDFELEAVGVRIDGVLVAFTLHEAVTETLMSLLFSKADRRFRGIGDYLLVSMLRHHRAAGRTHLNVAEDLGIPTLRRYKRSLRPAAIAEKYTVRL